MSKHTPGPWTTRQQFANRWLIEKDQGTNDAGEKLIPLCLAAVHTTILEVGCGERDAEANAHLIAAAPDMLDMLKAVVRWKDVIDVAAPDLGGFLSVLYYAEAVIAKAEDRS
ncbi:hypothetical protein [Sinorhizobium meliloti]|uniref:hypothetical protein n=1 Tax=Rhizobium meliloti TaxID=382 RepID=UPI000FD3F50E|nr:hypothetical protein [Sinorhizobium meliloti]RVJ77582.1 hypothetical protein CN171_06800 [Sinorhizobium meliloti]